jgi:uncharacterized membrane protein YvbJ
MQILCKNCGNEIDGNSPICMNCGVPVPENEISSSTKERMKQENNKTTSNVGTSVKAFGALLIISGIVIDVISMFLIFSSSFSAFGTLTIIGTIAFLIGLAIISNS